MGVPALAIAGFLCVLAVLAYALLRHVYLAALTIAAPLCVLAASFVLPHAWRGLDMTVAVLFAPVCTLLINDRVSRSVCMGMPAREAVALALKEIAAAAGPILTAYVLALFVLDPGWMAWTSRASDAVTAVAAFAVSLALGTVAMWLPYSEDFIARANAARERRERLFEHMSGLSETRWSFSVSGIAMVLAAVALFGIRGLHVPVYWRGATGFAGSAVLLAVVFAAIARNWRLALAAILAVMLVALLTSWMLARIDSRFVIPLELWLLVVPALVPMSLFILRMSRHLTRDENPPLAVARTLGEQGPATFVAFLALTAAATVDALRSGLVMPVLFMPAFAGLAAALLFFPAFGNTLYWLLPRYRSVDEVFGKR